MPEQSPANAPEINPRYALIAAGASVTTVCVLILIKLFAYIESGAAVMLATTLDSFIDAGVSVIMLMAVRLSLKPADTTHRHGHGKAEGLAALFQSAMMFGGAAFLLLEAGHRFITPSDMTHHALAAGTAAVAVVLSAILVTVQRYVLSRAPSLAIEADRSHYMTDIALNASVIAAIAIDYYDGPGWVDPACALFIAGYFLLTAYTIGMKGLDMLMDRELPDEVRERIKDIVRRHEDVHDLHDLRTRQSGMTQHISFDVEIDPRKTLREAHDVTRAVEGMILLEFPQAEVIIHMDPLGDPDDARHVVEGVHR